MGILERLGRTAAYGLGLTAMFVGASLVFAYVMFANGAMSAADAGPGEVIEEMLPLAFLGAVVFGAGAFLHGAAVVR